MNGARTADFIIFFTTFIFKIRILFDLKKKYFNTNYNYFKRRGSIEKKSPKIW